MGMPVPIPPLHRTALADEITTLYAHINVATCRLLELIADFDALGYYAGFGALSTAHWLTWACGIGPAAAREKVRVARALAELPRVHAAFRAGRISYSKVRALTRVATPACEETLLDMAGHATAAQTERIMRNYRQALSLDPPEVTRQPLEPDLHCLWDDSGCLVIRGRLSPDQGAVFQKAFEHALETVNRTAGEGAPWEREDYPASARRADALVMLAERAITAEAGEASTADRFQVTVHVSAETLAAEEIAPDEATDPPRSGGLPRMEDLPQIDPGPVIAPEVARRLCCDGSVIPMLTSESGEILNVGRRTRTIPPALRRALERRDGGCRFPGCEQRRHVDGHHIHHWARGGETRLDNLVSLCRRHHTLVHEGGYAIRKHRAARGLDFEFVGPSGEVVPRSEDLRGGDWEKLVMNVSAETPHLHASTLTPDLDWRPPDYHHIAWWMVNFMPR